MGNPVQWAGGLMAGLLKRKRQTALVKARASIADLSERLRRKAADCDRLRVTVERLTESVGAERERAEDLDVQVRRQAGTIDVLQAQVEGQAKVIVCQQTTIDAMTARASAQIATAHLTGGMTDAQRLLTRS